MSHKNWKILEQNRTVIMGILNITPDSFSDGGDFMPVDRAVEHAKKMLKEGASIIDIGGESSRPGAKPISAEEEIRRILPVLEKLMDEVDEDFMISIDSRKAIVARKALEAGADLVNDISALGHDAEMPKVIAEMNAGVILMHMKGNPKTMQNSPTYDDLIGEISAELRKSIEIAETAGIRSDRIIVDPGIGFGKSIEHNLEILRQLQQFKKLGKPILVGTSRKSFIGKILGLPIEERIEGTAATVAWAIANGAKIVRVHDLREMSRVARMTDALMGFL